MVRVVGQRRGISGTWWSAVQSGDSGTLYIVNKIGLSYILLYTILCIWWSSWKNYHTPSESQIDQVRVFFTFWGMVFMYPEIRVIPMHVEHWLSLCLECNCWMARVFRRWSRHQYLANLLSDPMQIQWKSLHKYFPDKGKIKRWLLHLVPWVCTRCQKMGGPSDCHVSTSCLGSGWMV